MPERWTGEVVGEMHCHNVKAQDLAEEMGVTNEYMSMLLNSKREPPNAEQRVKEALRRIVEAKNAEGKAECPEARQN